MQHMHSIVRPVPQIGLCSVRPHQEIERNVDEVEKSRSPMTTSICTTREAMRQERETIHKLADMRGCVLIRGESATGKELAARALHYLSHQRTRPFVVVICAAIPELLVESTLFIHRSGASAGAIELNRGRFETAVNGTIFLDEFGDTPPSRQTSLLWVFDTRRYASVDENRERKCRARSLLATNKDLRELVRKGFFREDLFYRINATTQFMPPLRNHPEEVLLLSEILCCQLAREMGRKPVSLSSEARDPSFKPPSCSVIRIWRNWHWRCSNCVLSCSPFAETALLQTAKSPVRNVSTERDSSEPCSNPEEISREPQKYWDVIATRCE